MPDREDAAAGGGHLSLVRAAPLCMAMWSVVSLWISYCGSSGVHRRMWPLYSVSLVCTRVITPETRPASEFHPTWSPTENLVISPPFALRSTGRARRSQGGGRRGLSHLHGETTRGTPARHPHARSPCMRDATAH